MKQLIEQATEFLKMNNRKDTNWLFAHVHTKAPTVIVFAGWNVSYSTLRVVGSKT